MLNFTPQLSSLVFSAFAGVFLSLTAQGYLPLVLAVPVAAGTGWAPGAISLGQSYRARAVWLSRCPVASLLTSSL